MSLQVLASDKNLRLNDYSLLGQVQSFDWNPNFNPQDIFELGNSARTAVAQELETAGSFSVLSIGNTPGLLARMIARRTASGIFQGFQYDPSGVGGKNAYTFTQDSLRECLFTVISQERPDQANWTRSLILPRCYLTTISGRAEANGSAQETFNFAGDFVIGASQPYHNVRAVHGTRTSGTTVTLADTGITNTSHGLMYLYINERPVRTSPDQGVSASLGAGGVITLTGLTVPENAFIQAIVWNRTPTTTFPSLSGADRGTTAFFVRGWQADIYIAPVDAAAPTQNEKWLRVQTVDWNIDLRTEPLRQVAFSPFGNSVYARIPTYPLNITLNANTLESDWADWKAILNPSVKPLGTGGTTPYADTYDFAPNSLLDTFAVVVRYFTRSGTLLQEWRFTDMKITGYGQSVQVGGRAEISWNLTGTAFTLTGFNA